MAKLLFSLLAFGCLDGECKATKDKDTAQQQVVSLQQQVQASARMQSELQQSAQPSVVTIKDEHLKIIESMRKKNIALRGQEDYERWSEKIIEIASIQAYICSKVQAFKCVCFSRF